MAPHRQGSVRQRSRESHQTPDGRTHGRTFDSRREAEAWLATEATRRVAGTWTDRRHGQITLATWAATWLADANQRPSTRARAESALRSCVLPRFGTIHIGALTTADLRGWLAELSRSRLSPATVSRNYRVLSACLQMAADDRLIPTNPTRSVKAPAVPRSEMRFLDPRQVARLANAIHPTYRAFIYLGAYSGLRCGELCGLRVGRINTTTGTVTVAEQLIEVSGHLHFGEPKTRAGHRAVTVPSYVLDQLRPHLDGRAADELVFTAPKGGPLRRTLFASRFFRPAARAAGYGGLRIHDLRHTAVSLWVAAGATPLECAKRAGHTSVNVVLDRYGHLYPDAYQATTDRLETLARASSENQSSTGQDSQPSGTDR